MQFALAAERSALSDSAGKPPANHFFLSLV
jgi:hypothetical protein